MNVLKDYNTIREMLIKHREEALAMIPTVSGDSGKSVKAADRLLEYALRIGDKIDDVDHDMERIEDDIKRAERRFNRENA